MNAVLEQTLAEEIQRQDSFIAELRLNFNRRDKSRQTLMIASSQLDTLVPKQMSLAFRSIGDAIAASGVQSLSISDVKLVRNDDPLPKAIRICIRTDTRSLVRAHFTSTTVNGIFIKEMIVLRAA